MKGSRSVFKERARKMVRPAASTANKQLMAYFAEMVTYRTENANDWVARTGSVSVFGAFTQCCVSCVRVHKQGPSDGITQLESNKVLEGAAGFKRVRSRRAKPALAPEIGGEEGDGPGYYFAYRRWRNPRDPWDLAQMKEGWEFIVRNHKHVSIGCTFDRMIEVVERCRNVWALKNPMVSKKRKRGAGWKEEEQAGSPSLDAESDGDSEGEEVNTSDMSALDILSAFAVKKAKKEAKKAQANSGAPNDPNEKEKASVNHLLN